MMTKEEKELLLKDLSARLPYGVKILHEGWDYERDDEMSTRERVVGIDEHFIYTKVIDTHSSEEYRDDKHPIDTFDDKLYLRPMSSMTEEEVQDAEGINRLKYIDGKFANLRHFTLTNDGFVDWLNARHFDYRGLIPIGLALEAPEDMYKI